MASSSDQVQAAQAPQLTLRQPALVARAAPTSPLRFAESQLTARLGSAPQGDGAPLEALMGVGEGARAALAGVRHLLGRGERTEVFGPEVQFVLRCAHGSYLRAAADGAVTASGSDPADDACVFVVQKGGVALHMRCTLRLRRGMRRLARLPSGEVCASGGTEAGAGAPDAEKWLIELAEPASGNRALVVLRCRRPTGGGDWDHALAAAPDGTVRVAPYSAGSAQHFRMLDPNAERVRCGAQRAAAEHAAAEAAARKRAAELAAALSAAQLEADGHAAQREAALLVARAAPATHADTLRSVARHMREALGYTDAGVEGELVVSARALAAAADPAASGDATTRRGPVMQLVGDAAPPSPYEGRDRSSLASGNTRRRRERWRACAACASSPTTPTPTAGPRWMRRSSAEVASVQHPDAKHTMQTPPEGTERRRYM